MIPRGGIHKVEITEKIFLRWEFSIKEPLWLMINRLPYVANYLCHMTVTFSFPSFNLFQNVTVDVCGVDWTHWIRGWIILLWSSCRQSCCNILDTVFCGMYGLPKREYKLFTVILELHAPMSFESTSSFKSSFPCWIPFPPERIITWREMYMKESILSVIYHGYLTDDSGMIPRGVFTK